MSLLTHATGCFRHRDFRWMFGGTFLSTALQWLQQTTLGWLVYDITGSGTLVGVVLGVRAIPILLLSPFSGVVADRYDRRYALTLTQVFIALPAFLIAAALALGAIATWQLFLFMLASGATATFDRTLRNAVLFDILPREEVASGLALMNIAFSVTRAFGPALAGLLIALAGASWNFAIQGLLAVGVMLSLTRLSHKPAAMRAQRSSAWMEMKAGLRYGVTDPVVRVMLLLNFLTGFLLIPTFAALLPIFAADIFQVGPQGLGLMLGAVGVGSILGSALATFLSRFDRAGMLQTLCVLAFALSIIGFAVSPGMSSALILLAIGGCAELLLLTSIATAMQLSAPEAMRGRVTALVSLFPAFISSGMFLAGWSADLVGAPATTILLALTAAAVSAFAWQRSSVLRDLRLSRLIAGRLPAPGA